MNIDEKLKLDRQQAAIVFGHPIPNIAVGARSSYAGFEVEITGITNDGVQIRRVAFDAIPHGETPTSSTTDSSHPLDAFNDGAARDTEKMTGRPVKLPRLPKPGEQKGGEIVTKPEILDPSTSPHPAGYFTNPPLGGELMTVRESVNDATAILKEIKRLRKAAGLDEPLISVKKES